MKTKIKTIHEEQYGDGGRILGVLQNFNIEGDFKESFIYTYKDEMYIFFNTFVEMSEYLLYGDVNIKRAYIKEDEFDLLYDNQINGKFIDILKWIK